MNGQKMTLKKLNWQYLRVLIMGEVVILFKVRLKKQSKLILLMISLLVKNRLIKLFLEQKKGLWESLCLLMNVLLIFYMICKSLFCKSLSVH